MIRWPFVSRTAYELALAQLRETRERNDRLTEAVSRSKGTAEVVMPQQPVTLEFSDGWFDTKRRDGVKETKYVQS